MGLGLKLLILVIVMSFCFSIIVPEATTIFNYFINSDMNTNSDVVSFVLSGLFNSINLETLLLLLGITGVTVLAGIFFSGSGNIALGTALAYIIPASLMMVLANSLLMPLGALFDLTNPLLPTPFNYLFIILINVMLLGSVITFVSGRDW